MTLCRTTFAVLFVVGTLSLATPALAKPEFAAKEKTSCPACHVMTEFPKRSDVGLCYKRHGYKNLALCQKDPTK
ncbi:MAG: hypothetical protein A3D65_04435 [Candidatus Lloydbacteria bacterium RIFCSPHIGHO2_02_FULL_50_13]|uniref:Uncharacterized protein n=1 Tax=Candidatus Lloydbacteria bacterium RIFCSPHIGHO2_02_FULL_50_13 TaxID=1798661 RepID=A0A1G2D2F1_9BACT|nr:MAG: hypothetical protein A3D65_04435 [Candidatus Lloydbacteria bacterium RIFCSPHIGHO2_02_FULL_50_13]